MLEDAERVVGECLANDRDRAGRQEAPICREPNFLNWRINVAVASRSIRMMVAMEIAILREKAALCLRIARRLSWNNPGRLELTELAQRFEQKARDLELQVASATAGTGAVGS